MFIFPSDQIHTWEMGNQKKNDFRFFRCPKMSMILSTFLITRLVKALSKFRTARQFSRFWPMAFRVYVFSLRRQLNEHSAEHDVAGIAAKILHSRKNVGKMTPSLLTDMNFANAVGVLLVSQADCRRELEKIAFSA